MRYLNFNAVFCVVIYLSIFPVLAGATTLDFEALSDSESVNTQFPGVTFSNSTVITAGISLNEFEFPPRSGTDVVFDDGGPVMIEFITPQLSISAFFTYLLPITLEAFDSNDTLIGSVTSTFSSNLALSGDPNSSPNELIGFSGLGPISRLVISSDAAGGSFVLDDLSFTASVPEPGILSLLGFGLAGLRTMRFRRVKATDIRAQS